MFLCTIAASKVPKVTFLLIETGALVSLRIDVIALPSPFTFTMACSAGKMPYRSMKDSLGVNTPQPDTQSERSTLGIRNLRKAEELAGITVSFST